MIIAKLKKLIWGLLKKIKLFLMIQCKKIYGCFGFFFTTCREIFLTEELLESDLLYSIGHEK